MKYPIPNMPMPDWMKEEFDINDGRLSEVLLSFYEEWVADGYYDQETYEESGFNVIVECVKQLEKRIEERTERN